jgi:1-acyl-sn-glycerol-3-phosphate acyltransferase
MPDPSGRTVAPPGPARPVGSLLHGLCASLAAVVFAVIATLVRPLPLRLRFRIISGWARFSLACLRLFCGVRIRVEGLEHIPSGPAVIASKHQSALETLYLQRVFPPHAWVLKRELLWIPFFGWGLASLEPIAIERAAQRQALRQVFEQGLERLSRGIWVLIFPEGTRIPPGQSGRYAQSAAALAVRAGCPIVPVAHNAGLCWPRRGWLRHAGTVTFRIGPPIDPSGRSAAELTTELEHWIERESRALLPD